jgi:hypothetical protein
MAQPPPQPVKPIVITFTRAVEPVPALRYRLVPERRSLVPGNAAIFYHRAIFMAQSNIRALYPPKPAVGDQSERIDYETVTNWSAGRIDDFPREKARKVLERNANVLKEVELGARRSFCDWEFDRRDEGIYLTLTEIQETRTLARLVTAQARLAIADQKFDDAMHWIETGMVLGRHVGEGPSLIQALVGIAIDTVMTRCLEDVVRTPNGPNLFWALADRPRPFIDMRYALEGERYLLEKHLPALKELDEGIWSVDQARRFAGEIQAKLSTISSGTPMSSALLTKPMDLQAMTGRLGVAAMAAKIYPQARRALIAEGHTESRVESMPVIQVAALYCSREYQRLRDESFKWMNLPYWQSYNRIDKATLSTVEQKADNPLLILFRMLTPSFNATRFAVVRLDRQLDALQCVEAIRLYTTAHQNTFPKNLEELTDWPVPIDVATGKPFIYERNGDSAILSAPVPPGMNHPLFAIHYELRLAR